MPTIAQLKKRDSYERDLMIYKNGIKRAEEDVYKVQDRFKQQLALYEKWKLANGVEGNMF
jgi:hypothetical protein